MSRALGVMQGEVTTDFWCASAGGGDVPMPAPYPQEFRDGVVAVARPCASG